MNCYNKKQKKIHYHLKPTIPSIFLADGTSKICTWLHISKIYWNDLEKQVKVSFFTEYLTY